MSPTLLDLIGRWESEAEVLERNADPRGAELLRLHVCDLQAALEEAGREVLTLSEASEISGYSVDHLRHEVSDGRIPNAGEKGRPRIRRADLPVKAGGGQGRGSTSETDADAMASDILKSLEGSD